MTAATITITGTGMERTVWVTLDGNSHRHAGRLERVKGRPAWIADERLRGFLTPPWRTDGWRTLALARMYLREALTQGGLTVPERTQ